MFGSEPDRDRSRPARLAITVVAVAVFASAPIEGYLIWVHPQLAKLPALVLLILWSFLRWRLQPRPQLHVVYLLLAALAVTVLMSTAAHVTAPFAVSYMARWIPFLLLTAVLVDIAASLVPIRLLLTSAVVGATLASVVGLYTVLVLHETRSTGPNTDPNDLACALVAALPLIMALAPRSRIERLALICAGALLTLAAIASLSRGALIALVVVVAYALVRQAIPVRATLGAGAAALVIGVIGVYFTRAQVLDALAQKQFIGQYNIDVRILRWEAALRMLGAHPALGVGPGGFRSEYSDMSNVAEIGIPAEQFVAHNAFLEVGAELGLVGMVLFVALIVTAFLAPEAMLRRGGDRRLAVAVQASLLANVIAVMFLSGQYFFSLWSMIAIGCAVGIRAGCRDPR